MFLAPSTTHLQAALRSGARASDECCEQLRQDRADDFRLAIDQVRLDQLGHHGRFHHRGNVVEFVIIDAVGHAGTIVSAF